MAAAAYVVRNSCLRTLAHSVDGYCVCHCCSFSSLVFGLLSFRMASYRSYSARSFHCGCLVSVVGDCPCAAMRTGAIQNIPAIVKAIKYLIDCSDTPRLPILKFDLALVDFGAIAEYNQIRVMVATHPYVRCVISES